MHLIHSSLPTVAARANWGRWIADCLSCPSADRLQPGTPLLVCRDCGAWQQVVWPDESMVQGVERLLMMRPDPNTRSWWPGETLTDLLQENVDHGVFYAEPGQSISIVGDRIELDTLPAGTMRQAIGA